MAEIPAKIPAPNFSSPDIGPGFMPDISSGQAKEPEMPVDNRLKAVAHNLVELSERPGEKIRLKDLGLESQQIGPAVQGVPMSPEVATYAPAAQEAARALSEAVNPQPKGMIEGYRPAGADIGMNTPNPPGSPYERQN